MVNDRVFTEEQEKVLVELSGRGYHTCKTMDDSGKKAVMELQKRGLVEASVSMGPSLQGVVAEMGECWLTCEGRRYSEVLQTA